MNAIAKFCRLADGVVGIALLLFTLALFIAGYCSQWFWPLEMLAHLRLIYIGLFLIALVLLLMARYKKLAILATILILFACFDVCRYWWPGPTHLKTSVQLRVVQMNLWGVKNREYEKTINAAKSANADVIALSEVTEPWWQRFVDAFPEYRYQIAEPQHGGIALMSKYPLTRADVVYFGEIKRPRILVQVRTPEGVLVNLDFVHPVTPFFRHPMRDQELEMLADEVKQWQGPTVLFGDFNCSPWSPQFDKLLSNAGLHDSEMGIGIQPSWAPHGIPIPLIPIDHVLLSKEVVAVNRHVGSDFGSDHRPVTIDLGLQAPQ